MFVFIKYKHGQFFFRYDMARLIQDFPRKGVEFDVPIMKIWIKTTVFKLKYYYPAELANQINVVINFWN